MRMVELFTSGPARVLGLPRRIAENEPADLTIFSTEHKWTFRAEESASKSKIPRLTATNFVALPLRQLSRDARLPKKWNHGFTQINTIKRKKESKFRSGRRE